VNFISLPQEARGIFVIKAAVEMQNNLPFWVWSNVVSIQPDEDMAMASGSSHDDNVPIINSYELNYVVPRLSHRYESRNTLIININCLSISDEY
jgi:hypothetical protein